MGHSGSQAGTPGLRRHHQQGRAKRGRGIPGSPELSAVRTTGVRQSRLRSWQLTPGQHSPVSPARPRSTHSVAPTAPAEQTQPGQQRPEADSGSNPPLPPKNQSGELNRGQRSDKEHGQLGFKSPSAGQSIFHVSICMDVSGESKIEPSDTVTPQMRLTGLEGNGA